MKQWSVILVLGIVIIWLAIAAGCQGNTQEIEDLNSRISNMEWQLNTLSSKVTTLQNEVNGTNTTTATSSLETLAKAISDLRSKVNSLENELYYNVGGWSKIDDLEKRVKALE